MTSRSNNVVEIKREALNLRLDARTLRLRALQELAKQFQSQIQSQTSFAPDNPESFAEGVITLMDGRVYRLSLKLEDPK